MNSRTGVPVSEEMNVGINILLWVSVNDPKFVIKMQEGYLILLFLYFSPQNYLFFRFFNFSLSILMFLGPTTAYPNFSEPAPKRFNAEQPPSNVSKDGEEKKANLEDRGRCVIF